MVGHGRADVLEADLGRGTWCEDAAVRCVATGAQEYCSLLIGNVDVIGREVEGCSFDVGLPAPGEVKRTEGAVGRHRLDPRRHCNSVRVHSYTNLVYSIK